MAMGEDMVEPRVGRGDGQGTHSADLTLLRIFSYIPSFGFGRTNSGVG